MYTVTVYHNNENTERIFTPVEKVYLFEDRTEADSFADALRAHYRTTTEDNTVKIEEVHVPNTKDELFERVEKHLRRGAPIDYIEGDETE